MPNNNYILTPDGNFVSEDELYHYGVLGMKWGVRKDIRSSSSAYDSKNKRWTREPAGGSLKKQKAVMDAEARVKLARGRSERKAAKAGLKSAKKNLKAGYKEYRAFEKDMGKKYGKSKNYVFDPDTKQITNTRTRQTIEKFEHEGLMNYETYKTFKRAQITNGAATTVAALSAIGTVGLSVYKMK